MTDTPTAPRGGLLAAAFSALAGVFAKKVPTQPAEVPKPSQPAPAASAAVLPAGVSEADIDTATRTLYGENRGGTDEGLRAVGHSIINRWRKPCWWSRNKDDVPDDTIQAVCLDPAQYSCWLKSDPNRAKMERLSPSDPQYQRCRKAFLAALSGADITGGATHYYSIHIAAPAWVKGATFTGQFDDHRFYKDVP